MVLRSGMVLVAKGEGEILVVKCAFAFVKEVAGFISCSLKLDKQYFATSPCRRHLP